MSGAVRSCLVGWGVPVAVRGTRGPTILAIVSATAFVVLTLLVATHATERLDLAARDLFRPGDVWGPVQRRVDVVVEGLKPRNVAPLLVLVGVWASYRQSSWRPVVSVALIGCATAGLTLATKLLLERSDPHYEMSSATGSFPSGHVAVLLVCLGAAVLVLQARSRWWQWVVVALAAVGMGLSLLVQAAHWFTDVVGGTLLAVTVLAAASLPRLREQPRHRW